MNHLILTSVFLICIQNVLAGPALRSKLAPVDMVYECVHESGGGSKGAPLLLLHGMGQSKEDWDGTYETLAFSTGRRVCRADLRNQGDSPWDNETSVAAMTEDIVHWMDTLGEETAVLIGHSLGGKVAIDTALNYPERVDSIVIEDITPNSLDPSMVLDLAADMKKMMSLMELVPEGSDEKQATDIIVSILLEELMQQNVTVDEERVAQTKLPLTCPGGKCRWKTNFALIVHVYLTDFAHFWTPSSGQSHAPALFIYGTESKFKVFDELDSIREFFPEVQFVAVKGAGHTIHSSYPKRFEDEILKFLD